MTAGYNIKIAIWRMSTMSPDDEFGGARVTGTIAYEDVRARLEELPPTIAYLESGMEIDTVWNIQVGPGILDIRERDLIELTSPLDHLYLGWKFRVRGVRRGSLRPRDSRSHMELVVTRAIESRSIQ